MANYKPVKDALAAGADLAMLCETCPWDRYCITPPSMTSAEVEQAMAESKAKDEEESARKRAAGEQVGMPVGSLLTTIIMSGKDSQAELCPVFSARLRSSQGRSIVDGFKAQMAGWDDEA